MMSSRTKAGSSRIGCSQKVTHGFSAARRSCRCRGMWTARLRSGRSLAVYRMVFGQPRQDDLLEFILREVPDDRRDDLATALTIDLSPPS